VRPTDTGSFIYACLTLSSPSPSAIDIISIDFAAHARLPFQLKRSAVLKAIADGVVFEVAYSPALRTDQKDARRNILAGARELIRVTSGKGVIFSSDARAFLEIRSPADVQNLCVVSPTFATFTRSRSDRAIALHDADASPERPSSACDRSRPRRPSAATRKRSFGVHVRQAWPLTRSTVLASAWVLRQL